MRLLGGVPHGRLRPWLSTNCSSGFGASGDPGAPQRLPRDVNYGVGRRGLLRFAFRTLPARSSWKRCAPVGFPKM